MKTIDQMRRTNCFCFSAGFVEDMAKIAKHYGAALNSVARDGTDNLSHFTVRLLYREGDCYILRDARVIVRASVEELESVEIRREPCAAEPLAK